MTHPVVSFMIATTQRPRERAILRKGWRHMRLSRAIADYLDSCRLRKLSPTTVRTYDNVLAGLLRVALVHGPDQVAAFTPTLVRYYFDSSSGKGNGATTLLKKRSTVTKFAAWGLRERLWATDPAVEAPAYRKPERLPIPFERGDRAELMALPMREDERLLRALLYYAGLRAGEILRLRVQDVRLGDGGQRLGRLVIAGKGDRQRLAPIVPELDGELRRYLAGPGLPPERPLLAKPDGAPWSYRMLLYRVTAWGASSDVLQCRPHRFRHTTATEMFEAGADPRATQRAMGHASLQTTMLYTKVVDDEVDRAVLLRSRMLAERKFSDEDSLRHPGDAR